MDVIQRTVKNIADWLGVKNVTLKQESILGKETEIFILKILENAKSFAISSKRQKMNTSDINNSLQAFGIAPLVGYKNSKKMKTFVVPFSHEESLLVYQEKKVDLKTLASSEIPPYQISPHFELSFLVHDLDDLSIFSRDQIDEKEEKVVEEEGESIHAEVTLSRLQNYFNKTIEYITYNNKRFEVILMHLSKDVCIGKLLTRYIEFYNDFLIKNQDNLVKMKKAVNLLTAICINKEFRIDEFIDKILSFGFTFLTTHAYDETASFMDKVRMRDKAGFLIALISEQVSIAIPEIKAQVSDTLEQIEASACEAADPFNLYGALITYSNLGIDIIRLHVIERMTEIYNEVTNESFSNEERNLLCGCFCDLISNTLHYKFSNQFIHPGITLPILPLTKKQMVEILNFAPHSSYGFCETIIQNHLENDEDIIL